MANSEKKVLVVEDDKNFLWILRQGLEEKNLSVIFALDGEEGLIMAEQEKPDLILLDIMLPKMDGITMAKKLIGKGIKPNIIFLTNLKDAEHMSTALDAVGETEYIIKSDLHIDQIVDRVREKLGIK